MMFTEETVFILGAGASWHYGYPTGEELVQKVIRKTNEFLKLLDSKKKDGYGFLVWELQDKDFAEFKFNNTRETFKENCKALAARLHQTNTLVIDYFLSQQSKGIQEIGKFMISWIILDCERDYFEGSKNTKSNNYNKNRHPLNDLSKRPQLNLEKDDWYRFVLHKLIGGCHSQNKQQNKDSKYLNDNKVTFISFNYDVSLEQALLKGLQAIPDYFKTTEVKEFLSSERFIHIYGQIRENSYLEKFVEKFSPIHTKQDSESMPDFEAIYKASQSIWTIKDDKANNKNAIETAKKKIKSARNIYILGFGFDEENCDRIQLSQLAKTNRGTRQKICFTNFGNKDAINKRVNRILELGVQGGAGATPFYRGGPNFIPHNGKKPDKSDWTNAYERSIVDVYTALEEDIELI